MRFDFGAEVGEDILERRASSLAQAAVRQHSQIIAQRQDFIQVAQCAAPFGDAREDLEGALGAHPAGRALAAAFAAEEVDQLAGQVHHAGVFVAD